MGSACVVSVHVVCMCSECPCGLHVSMWSACVVSVHVVCMCSECPCGLHV